MTIINIYATKKKHVKLKTGDQLYSAPTFLFTLASIEATRGFAQKHDPCPAFANRTENPKPSLQPFCNVDQTPINLYRN